MEKLEILGIVIVAIIIVTFFATAIALLTGYYLIKKDKALLPEITMLVLNVFYIPAKYFSVSSTSKVS